MKMRIELKRALKTLFFNVPFFFELMKLKWFIDYNPADGVFQMDFFAGAANLLKCNAGVQS